MSLNKSSLVAQRARFRSPEEVIGAFRRQLLAGAQAVRAHSDRPGVSNFLEWCRWYTPHYFSLPPSQQHVYTAQQLQYASQKRGIHFVLEGPRDSAKSTLVTFGYPLWAACEGFENYILLCADTGPQAKKYLEAISTELEHNARIKASYPHVGGVGPVWNQEELVTNSGCRIEALGSLSRIRGLRFMQHRPSCVIADDPEGEAAAYSITRRTRVREWYTKGVLSVGSPTCNYFLTGTRIHRECLTAHIAGQPLWINKAYRSIMRWPDDMGLWSKWENIFVDQADEQREGKAREFYDLNRARMEAGVEVLWTPRIDLYALMSKRALMGHAAFESEYQNNPIDPSKCEWQPALFDGDDLWFDEWPKLSRLVLALDPSKGKSDRQGDYQALLAVGWLKGVLYVDADIARRPIDAMMQNFLAWGSMLAPDVAVVESDQFQEVITNNLDTAAQEQDLPFVVEPIETGGVNKKVRIRRLSPWLSQRRMRFRRRSPGIKLLLSQLQDFPLGDHDDGPDALEMAVRKITQGMHGGQGTQTENPY